ncbi:pseudouridine synthase [Venturia nashicola]|nr:pseudouridine synthase [Venturia nashicola]
MNVTLRRAAEYAFKIPRLGVMTTPNEPIVEGIFAIHKPPSVTSFDIIRTLQPLFKKSALFAPLLARERNINLSEPRTKARFKRDRKDLDVKIGHGGTLDPIATGVLIIGVGRGTKVLSRFLECTKNYETTVLFGAATDSYDRVGKVVGRAPYEHITKEQVEEALGQFRGDIMQKPPIFSALRVNGKRMYEYAREGGEIPEVKERPLHVEELELVKFLESGTHEFKIPKEWASTEEREFADKVLHIKDLAKGSDGSLKRKRDEQSTEEAPPEKAMRSSPRPETAETAAEEKEVVKPAEGDEPMMSGALQPTRSQSPELTLTSKKGPPAAVIKMTVSSGFYVRSLCHDLGTAVGSLGLMSTLVRTRQAQFELGKNVLDYDDLTKGEEVWGPKIEAMLKEWQEKEGDQVPEEDGKKDRKGKKGHSHPFRENSKKSPRKQHVEKSDSPPAERSRRRNTSSAEP